jgi:hypothetical protein
MAQNKKLIIFFVPPVNKVNGGIMSIFAHARESRKFEHIHDSEVVICTYPGHDTYKRNDNFENDERVYSFDEIATKWRKPTQLSLNIPENAVGLVGRVLYINYRDYLQGVKDIHINVMNQNIDLMLDVRDFAELFMITTNVTQTTAHDRYTTQELSDKYQTPVHHLAPFNDKRHYNFLRYRDKQNLIIYSPDEHPAKQRILKKLNALPGYTTREIKDMTHEEFKELAVKAKFSVTFGEGFDGYFIKSFFSGSIGLAVYNDRFFPEKDYAGLSTVFKSYKEMSDRIVEVIESLDNKADFDRYSLNLRNRIGKLYNYHRYQKKLENLYKRRYDYRPKESSARALIGDMLGTHHEAIESLKSQLNDAQLRNQALEAELLKLMESRSWKLTEPLRKVNYGLTKYRSNGLKYIPKVDPEQIA